jgi:uncharacterized spore protein YtfJ
MTEDIQRLLDTFADLRESANVNACFGEPVTVEGRTVIPVAKVSYGFGMGAEHGAPPGAAPQTSPQRSPRALPEASGEVESPETWARGPHGGGMKSSPLGVIEVTREETRIEPVIDEQKVALIGMLVGAWSVFWLGRVLVAIFGRRE